VTETNNTPDASTSLAPINPLDARIAETFAKTPPYLPDGRQNPEYWRTYNQHMAGDLIRGRAEGLDYAVGPEGQAQSPVPAHRSGYQLEGLAIYDGETRDIVDSFLARVHPSGIWGQAETKDALRWALTTDDLTPKACRDWAIARGLSDAHIASALPWIEKAGGRALAAPARRTAPPVPAATPDYKAQRRAEIQAVMYDANGKQSALYWKNEALQAEYRSLL
jgi:hypothetical protein